MLNFKSHSLFPLHCTVPAGLEKWLYTQDSLTDQLKTSTGTAELKVLNQEWQVPSWWDQVVLHINDSMVFSRDIVMASSGQNYWFARSVIPQSCFEANPEFFSRLERESIRNLIFECDEVSCESRIQYPVNDQCLEYHWASVFQTKKAPILWVRLAVFCYRKSYRFYLAEILFPELGQL